MIVAACPACRGLPVHSAPINHKGHHMEYPFDESKTAYAVVHATRNGEFGHIAVRIFLPELARDYQGREQTPLHISSQCDKENRGIGGGAPEPFYALRLTVQSTYSEGLNLLECERAARVLSGITKRVAKIDALAGSPAVLLPDYVVRILRAARVTHILVPPKVGVNPWHADPPRWITDYAALHNSVASLKRALLSELQPSDA